MNLHNKKRQKSFFVRLFVSVYLLFAVVFNVSMYAVISQCYRLEVAQSKDRAASEQYNAATTMTRDLVSMEEAKVTGTQAIISDFLVYQKYYESQGISIELFHNNNILVNGTVTAESDKRAELAVEQGKQNLVIRTEDSGQYVFVASSLGNSYDSYVLVLAYSLQQAADARDQMLLTMAVIDVAVSLLLGVILYLLLRRLMNPLSELSKATKEVADGHYEKTIPVTSEDEFGALARQFNRMSESISDKIAKLHEENQKKEILINDMAHELRTPLTAMLGYSEYLQMANIAPEEKTEVLDHIIHETKRLSRLSDTLLYLARIHADQIEMKPILCRDLIETLQFLFHKRAEEEQITITFTEGANSFLGNREMIEILMTNLIENAIRACSAGGKIHVCFKKISDSQVKVSVSDDGIGMEEKELAKIAQPFYRIDKARSRKNGGVGLGVSLCFQIAAYHETTLEYESCLKKGTTVSAIFTT